MIQWKVRSQPAQLFTRTRGVVIPHGCHSQQEAREGQKEMSLVDRNAQPVKAGLFVSLRSAGAQQPTPKKWSKSANSKTIS
jgi:hypothetical protein